MLPNWFVEWCQDRQGATPLYRGETKAHVWGDLSLTQSSPGHFLLWESSMVTRTPINSAAHIGVSGKDKGLPAPGVSRWVFFRGWRTLS